jgi:hypothetical protein
MSGLEKRECDPRAGAGQWAAKRTGQLLAAASGVVAADGLIASGCHWSIPALRGVPTEYQFFGGLNAAAGLAKSLVASGVAQADVWFRTGRDPFRFIEQTLKDRIAAHGGREIDKDLFLGVGLVPDLDPCGTGVAELADGNEMYLVVEPDSAGYVVLGPTLRLLEIVHPRLPLTFFNLFTHALNRWVRVYDYRDAAERVEQPRSDRSAAGADRRRQRGHQPGLAAERQKTGRHPHHRFTPSQIGPRVSVWGGAPSGSSVRGRRDRDGNVQMSVGRCRQRFPPGPGHIGG